MLSRLRRLLNGFADRVKNSLTSSDEKNCRSVSPRKGYTDCEVGYPGRELPDLQLLQGPKTSRRQRHFVPIVYNKRKQK